MVKVIHSILFAMLFIVAFPNISHATVLDEVKQYVQQYYVGTIDGDIQNTQTIDEVIEKLDPYSAYLSKQQFQQLLNSIDMKTVGIGVGVEKHPLGVMITRVFEGGSASEAGIVAGDIITTINGQDAAPLELGQATSLIVGEENTTVTLTFLKVDGTMTTLQLVRKSFSVPNVTQQLLYGNVGYIALSSFSEDAVSVVKKAYQDLQTKGAASFIVDLQYNGGGYVSTAEQFIGLFPNAINAYQMRLANETYIQLAVTQNTLFPIDTKLLVNRYSASASEMTAAALLDQHAAILYGETTYGKGSMQQFFPLNDGGILKLTVGIFSGPNGTPVNQIGLIPNVKTTTDAIYQAHFDTLKQQFIHYKELQIFQNVSVNKTFTVNFSNQLKTPLEQGAVELVALGGNVVDITMQVKENLLFITPQQPLKHGAHYMLVVHPKVLDASEKRLTTGVYNYITVTNN